MDKTNLPDGYYILDGETEVHDGDEQDGRYGLYVGLPEEGEFLGNLHDRDEVIRLAWQHRNGNLEDHPDEQTEGEVKLAEYEALKDSGEDYVECPRCEGRQTVSAVPTHNVPMASHYEDQMWRYSEDFPCPLCCTYGPDTIDVDKAIDWLQNRVDSGE